MIIVWSEEARLSYFKIIDYLIINWNINIILEFETKINKLLDHLKNYEDFCPLSKKQKLRRCVIHKNTSLIYKINKNQIELITFIDNSTNHKY